MPSLRKKDEELKRKRSETHTPFLFPNCWDLDHECSLYIMECDEEIRPYTITGLSLYLGTSRQTLLEYEKHRTDLSVYPELAGYSETIKYYKTVIENYAAEKLLTAKNPAGAIFQLKQFGWSDVKELKVTDKDGVAKALIAGRNRIAVEFDKLKVVGES